MEKISTSDGFHTSMEDYRFSLNILGIVKYWILQAKIVLGLSSSLKTEELQSEEIHEKFVQQLARVLKLIFNVFIQYLFLPIKSSLPNSKIDPR